MSLPGDWVKPRTDDFSQDVAGAWRWNLQILGLAWAGILLLFWRDASDMALIWWNSSTFNHCMVIVPILIWLVVQRKQELAQLTPVVWWPALVYVAAAAFGWLLGEAAGVAVARQLGLLMMLQGAAAAMLGPNVTRGLLFPLFYMFFLLPVGEEAVPALQTITAKMCMVMLDWVGVPAQIDGIFISTPAGLFRVAEACSGVKFLIAMVALGALISNICFSSGLRRLAFMAACFIVPVAANGVRAFATIYIAEFRGIESAAGFDHIFYGWIFFGIVIAIVVGSAWKYFDKAPDAPAFDATDLQGAARFSVVAKSVSAKAVFGCLLLIVAIPSAWSAVIAAQASPLPQNAALPSLPAWQQVDHRAGHHWSPNFEGASKTLFARYRSVKGQEVDLFVALYDRQEDGREIIGFGQGAVGPDSDWSWTENLLAPNNGKAERIIAHSPALGPVSRDVISYYRIGGITSGSARALKLATLKARLLGGNQQAVAILVSAQYNGAVSPRDTIDHFVKDLGDIDKLADQYAGVR